MKIIHFMGEFGPETMKSVRPGIYWNEIMQAWSVHTEWGHATCESISQAKRTQKAKLTKRPGSDFPIPINPEKCLKGGYNRKKNHLINHFDAQWLTKGQRNRIKRQMRYLKKTENNLSQGSC